MGIIVTPVAAKIWKKENKRKTTLLLFAGVTENKDALVYKHIQFTIKYGV